MGRNNNPRLIYEGEGTDIRQGNQSVLTKRNQIWAVWFAATRRRSFSAGTNCVLYESECRWRISDIQYYF